MPTRKPVATLKRFAQRMLLGVHFQKVADGSFNGVVICTALFNLKSAFLSSTRTSVGKGVILTISFRPIVTAEL
jgi:hypothetical protein